MAHDLDTEAAGRLLSALYRDTLVLITTAFEGKLNGQIALAALPASITPQYPRVLIELWQNNLTHDLIRSSGGFGLHFLHQNQLDLIRTFGFYHGHDRNKFAGLTYNLGENGNPRLADCAGWLDCRVIGELPTEDMTVFIGDVKAAYRPAEPEKAEPLTWTVARQLLPKDWLDEYNQTVRRENEAYALQRLQQS